METYGTPPCSSEGQVFYDNNHLNKIKSNRLSQTYRKDEVIVYLDKKTASHLTMNEKIKKIKETFCKKGIPIESITIRKCSNCDIDIPIFLMHAKNIDTVIVSEGLPGGTAPQPHTVGESYSLNFLSQIPHASWKQSDCDKDGSEYKDQKKEKVTIAVLDTGVDTDLVDPDYICKDFTPQKDVPCFSEIEKGGWNFLDDNDKYFDDNTGKHGSLVSQYIINQFTGRSNNRVKIMPLKTHDKNGGGDLFSIICAIHFAMAKGANIINASWGFYYYYDDRNFLEYFRNLIENELRKSGILFVTAAGNRIPKEDKMANDIYFSQHGFRLKNEGLRDLEIHRFFPAHLSTEKNNIVTVTTTYGTEVSREQNHSNVFVDLGVKSDAGPKTDPGFEVPFKLSSGTATVAGSSFATAIASGVIGANCDTKLYVPHLKKADFMTPPIFTTQTSLASKWIRNGTCIVGT
jgi:subtilisin family serine protease